VQSSVPQKKKKKKEKERVVVEELGVVAHL
jgi:hypothetical protein